MNSPIAAAVGLALVAIGLGWFFYPKPPPLSFASFLGGHTRLFGSTACIILGGVLAVLGVRGP